MMPAWVSIKKLAVCSVIGGLSACGGPAGPPLEILSFDCERRAEHVVYGIGEVKNISDYAFRPVLATITFRDADGKVKDTNTNVLSTSALQPGQALPFSISGTVFQIAGQCEVSFATTNGALPHKAGPHDHSSFEMWEVE